MLGDILGGVVGGAVVAILHKDGTLEVVNKRPVRRYHGYPSDTDGVTQNGDVPIIVSPPDGYGWEILAMLWYIEYDAAEAGGNPIINIRDRSGRLLVPVRHPNHIAGDIVYTYYTQGASFPQFVVGATYGVVYPLPMNGEMRDESLEFDADGAPADQHRVFVYVEEFEL